ncbi:hypothetical protein SAMN04487895_101723 [Paenibacillus sophorae]|uniref:Uncharacterized protein n=1 Tax=Paenibacillus sophorae TaxID=1333845 RepID=A0A1H8H0X7_9BACL|nr:hypothetical protein SAMN04487895_101723 [Paenibacillus sophorae]
MTKHNQSKREGQFRLILFIVMVPLLFVVQSNPYYFAFISIVTLYLLITAIYRLTRKE